MSSNSLRTTQDWLPITISFIPYVDIPLLILLTVRSFTSFHSHLYSTNRYFHFITLSCFHTSYLPLVHTSSLSLFFQQIVVLPFQNAVLPPHIRPSPRSHTFIILSFRTSVFPFHTLLSSVRPCASTFIFFIISTERVFFRRQSSEVRQDRVRCTMLYSPAFPPLLIEKLRC